MYKSVLVSGGFPKTDSSYGPSATCVGHFGGSGALATHMVGPVSAADQQFFSGIAFLQSAAYHEYTNSAEVIA